MLHLCKEENIMGFEIKGFDKIQAKLKKLEEKALLYLV